MPGEPSSVTATALASPAAANSALLAAAQVAPQQPACHKQTKTSQLSLDSERSVKQIKCSQLSLGSELLFFFLCASLMAKWVLSVLHFLLYLPLRVMEVQVLV
jgi:hypothetical protein